MEFNSAFKGLIFWKDFQKTQILNFTEPIQW